MILRLWLLYAIFLFVGKCSVLVITECQNGKATVGEGTTVTLRCGKYSVDIEWAYEDGSWSVIDQCTKTTCTTHHNLSFSLQAHETESNQYESVLSITNISSEQTFHLKCHSKDLDETAKCQLNVVKPPEYDRTSCKVWLSNWRVLGECTFERMPASGVDYDCYWSVNNKEKFGGFKDAPSYYTLHSINYTRRVCSFNRSMNFSETAYTYSMHVSGLKDVFTETIIVEHPGEATHNCPTMVREGSSVNCRCNSSKAGNPPANTVWDGVMNETLHIANIQRQDNTEVYTCRLVWGSEGQINRSTLYTLEVAQGPSSVRIDNIIDETGNETGMLRLMCTAVDVYPSAAFTWNIMCDNQTQTSNTSTCTFSPANASQEELVTCTAINNNFPDMSSFTSFVVDVTDGQSPGPKKLSPKDIPGKNLTVVYIVAGIFSVLIIIITVTAVGVCACRRKVFMSQHQESSSSESPLQLNRSTEYDELCDQNNPTLEAVQEGGASNFTQDEIDMSGLYANEVKFVKRSEPKRYTGDLGDLYTSVDKDKNERDAQFCQGASQLIRSAGYESDYQSTFEGCVAPSRDVYVNVSETCNRLDNRNGGQHSLRLEAANEDMNVPTTSNPTETTEKSGKSRIDSSMYLHPIQHQDNDDDTYNHLMA